MNYLQSPDFWIGVVAGGFVASLTANLATPWLISFWQTHRKRRRHNQDEFEEGTRQLLEAMKGDKYYALIIGFRLLVFRVRLYAFGNVTMLILTCLLILGSRPIGLLAGILMVMLYATAGAFLYRGRQIGREHRSLSRAMARFTSYIEDSTGAESP